MVKNPPGNAGDITDAGSIPGSGRSPGGGHDNPLQYSCLTDSQSVFTISPMCVHTSLSLDESYQKGVWVEHFFDITSI